MAHRRALRGEINELIRPTTEFLPHHDPARKPRRKEEPVVTAAKPSTLRVYLEDLKP